MNQGKYIFAQLTDFLPRRVFDTIVTKYDGNKKIRTFTCWNQMLCMIFGQLTARDSMRDLMLSLEAHNTKYYLLDWVKALPVPISAKLTVIGITGSMKTSRMF